MRNLVAIRYCDRRRHRDGFKGEPLSSATGEHPFGKANRTYAAKFTFYAATNFFSECDYFWIPQDRADPTRRKKPDDSEENTYDGLY